MKVNTTLVMDANEIIYNLVDSLTQEELIEFVKELDRNVEDYDFTKSLRDYFTKEIESEDEDLDVEEEG